MKKDLVLMALGCALMLSACGEVSDSTEKKDSEKQTSTAVTTEATTADTKASSEEVKAVAEQDAPVLADPETLPTPSQKALEPTGEQELTTEDGKFRITYTVTWEQGTFTLTENVENLTDADVNADIDPDIYFVDGSLQIPEAFTASYSGTDLPAGETVTKEYTAVYAGSNEQVYVHVNFNLSDSSTKTSYHYEESIDLSQL